MCLKADFTSERVGVVNNQSCQTRIRVISLIDLELLLFSSESAYDCSCCP